MKQKLFLVSLMAVVTFIAMSCDALWTVKPQANIAFSISGDVVKHAKEESLSLVRSVNTVATIDSDITIATISLHFEDTDAEIVSRRIALTDEEESIVEFTNLDIVGLNVYASILLEVEGIFSEGRSDAKTIIVGANRLHIGNILEIRIGNPAITPAGGVFPAGPLDIEIETSSDEAVIHYTLDGSEPSVSSEKYTGSIQLEIGETDVVVKAIAIQDGRITSQVITETYTMQGTVATPKFSPPSGNYQSNLMVGIETDTDNATIYYTLDGSDPSISETRVEYDGFFTITIVDEVLIQAIAIKEGMANSAITSVSYALQGTVLTPDVYYEGKNILEARNGIDFTKGISFVNITEGATISYKWSTESSFKDIDEGANTGRIPDDATSVTVKATKDGLVASGEKVVTLTMGTAEIPNILYGDRVMLSYAELDFSKGFSFENKTEGATISYKWSADSNFKEIAENANTGKIPDGTTSVTVKTTKDGLHDSEEYTFNFTQAKVSPPVLSSISTEIDFSIPITFTSATGNDVDFYYTVGSSPADPDPAAATKDKSVTLSGQGSPVTIKVIAVKDGYINSDITGATYTMAKAATPSIMYGGKELQEGSQLDFSQSFTFDSDDDDVQFAYKWNGASDFITLPKGVSELDIADGKTSITVKAVKENGLEESDVTATITFGQLQVAEPEITVDVQDVNNKTVTIKTTTDGADIFYTDNGADPETSAVNDTKKYTETITDIDISSESKTVKAIAVKDGYVDSGIETTVIAKAGQVETPKIDVSAVDASGNVTITINSTTTSANISYTVNAGGSSESQSGESPVTFVQNVSGNNVAITATATESSLQDSEEASVTIFKVLPTPTFTIGGSSVGNGATVDFSKSLDFSSLDATSYHYTTDGSEPTLSSPSANSISLAGLASPATVKVMAVAENRTNSYIASATFTKMTDYYVAVGSLDTNAGTASSPLLTVQEAVNRIKTAAGNKDDDTMYTIHVNGTTSGGTAGGNAVDITSSKVLNVSIVGNGSGIIDGQGNRRVLHVNGAGVRVTLGSGITITGGYTDGFGGGVLVASGATLTMNGDNLYIQGNNAQQGAGIFVNSATLVMEKGDIISNSALVHGGGITINGSEARATMSGGTISANESENNAGGVLVSYGTTFTMTGGTISHNKGGLDTTNNGGGVYVEGSATLNLSGTPTIYDNGSGGSISGGTWSGGKISNIFIAYSGDATVSPVKLVGGLTDGKIGITPLNSGAGDVIVQGANGYDIVDTDRQKIAHDQTSSTSFFSNDYFSLDTSGETSIKNPPTTFYVSSGGNGGNDSNGGTTSDQAFLTVQRAVNKIHEINDETSTYTINVSGTTYGGASGGNTVDITSSETLNIIIQGSSSGVIDGQGNRRGILVSGANVTVTLGTGLTIQNGLADAGGGVFISVGAEVILDGAIISDNRATSDGGGVYIVDVNSVFTINSGHIRSNTANAGGALTIAFGATSTMNEGTIGGSVEYANESILNSDQYGGGGVYVVSADGSAISKFTLNGGTISYNTKTGNGGGIFVREAALLIEGGNITHNSATIHGGGIATYGDTTEVTMTGGTISANESGNNAGGVLLNYETTFTMSGGTISNNKGGATTGNNGGGVYVEGSSTLNLRGNPTIYDNGSGGSINGSVWSGGKVSNVYIAYSDTTTASPVKLTGSLTGGKVGITPLNTDVGDVIVQGSGYSSSKNDTYVLVNDMDNNYGFTVSGGNIVITDTFNIGDAGPGGGLIYAKDGNTYKEVSDHIDRYNWETAKTIASSYNGGGNTGWSLPSLEELTAVYNALKKPGLPLESETRWYWSTSTEYHAGSSSMLPRVKSFYNGDNIDDYPLQIHDVRAIRTFTNP